MLHICLFFFFPFVSGSIYIIRGNSTLGLISDIPAIFGPQIPYEGFEGLVVKAHPSNGCTAMLPPPPLKFYTGPFIAIVKRYNCTFEEKVLNAQTAGFNAVIVRNVGSNELEIMSGDWRSRNVTIPSVFIGEENGILIEEHYLYNSGYAVVIGGDLPFNIKDYLLPFAITIGICFLILLSFMIIKCIRDYRQSRRHRLSFRALKKIPVHKFKNGDPYEVCAVCLEDYVEKDKLRVLPCSHAYHSKCIDPWLTKNRRVCPVCKRKVVTGDERLSDLDSSDSEDESSPLIHTQPQTHGGTFNPQRQNPFVSAAAENRAFNRLDEEEESLEEESDEEQPSSVLTHSTADVEVSVREGSTSGSDASSLRNANV